MTTRPVQVNVWTLDLRVPDATVDTALVLLDREEQERANAFRFTADRRRFIISHAMMRTLLAASLGTHPADLRFVTNAAGKPFLAAGGPAFNLSHSGEMAALAIVMSDGAAAALTGVDVEEMKLPARADDVARMFFAEPEYAQLEKMHGDALEEAFFRCWTRKEAVLKARGSGIDERALRELVVSLDAAPAVLHGADGENWKLTELVMPARYAGCVAVDGAGLRWSTDALVQTPLDAAAVRAALSG